MSRCLNFALAIVSHGSGFSSALSPMSFDSLKTEGNTIKERMLEDVLQGGTLPTKAVSENEEEGRDILDGLQRTDIEAQLSEIGAFEKRVRKQLRRG